MPSQHTRGIRGSELRGIAVALDTARFLAETLFGWENWRSWLPSQDFSCSGLGSGLTCPAHVWALSGGSGSTMPNPKSPSRSRGCK